MLLQARHLFRLRLVKHGGLLILAMLFSLSLKLAAQSWPQQTLWGENLSRLNPAVSSQLFSLDAAGIHRRQWVGIEGAPTTSILSLAAPVYIANAGISLGFEQDVIGAHSVSLFRGALSYGLLRGDNVKLSLGAGVNYRVAGLDGRELRTSTGVYTGGIITHFDQRLPATDRAASALGFDVGIALQLGADSEFGFSVLDLNEPVSDWTELNRAWPRQYLVYGRSRLPVAELLDLEVGALGQLSQTVIQAQAQAMLWYNGNIGVGTALRGFSGQTLDAASFMLGWKATSNITFGYAYDFGLSSLQRSHDGSHEIVLRYRMLEPIGKGRLPPVIYNPRL
jgi:Bacteroidetes-specific putative membrane protein